MKTMIDCTLYQWKRGHNNPSILFDVVHCSIFSQKWNVSVARNNSCQFIAAGFSA